MTDTNTLIDEYIEAREARLAADRVAADLDKKEKALANMLIANMRAEGNPIRGTSRGTVTMHTKIKHNATDWRALYDYIKANDAFDLLHKRITEEAVNVRKADGVVVPGVSEFEVYTLTVSNPR